jgi:hypothetical protein
LGVLKLVLKQLVDGELEGAKGPRCEIDVELAKILGCCSVMPLSNPTPPFYWQGMQEGVGEMREFESTAPGRRTRWPKRRRITRRE